MNGKDVLCEIDSYGGDGHVFPLMSMRMKNRD
jgi:hypothetical protein